MKAQVTAEFLVVVSALAAIFLIFYVVYFGQNINLTQSQDSIAAMRNAYALSAAMNYVYLAGEGAQYNFTLRKEQDENVTISNLSVESSRTHAVAQAPLLEGNTNASSVNGGQMVIRNNDGVIEIGQ
jgi:hypothetical protein